LIVASSPSIPIFTASMPMSPATALTWATMISGGIGWTAVTPTVFWAVIAVIAVIPWTPQAANALRSAWTPAPPPESEPAIERTRGMRRVSVIGRRG
jgi:cyanate permease